MLSPDQIHQYHEQGYVIPDYRLSDDTIEEIKIAHKRLIAKSPQFSDYCGALLIEDLSFLNYARDTMQKIDRLYDDEEADAIQEHFLQRLETILPTVVEADQAPVGQRLA